MVDLLSTTPEVEKPAIQSAELSPGLTLLMAQTLVEVMQKAGSSTFVSE
jgi:hypothetical protein